MHQAAASPAIITMAGLTGRQGLVFQVCRPCQAFELTLREELPLALMNSELPLRDTLFWNRFDPLQDRPSCGRRFQAWSCIRKAEVWHPRTFKCSANSEQKYAKMIKTSLMSNIAFCPLTRLPRSSRTGSACVWMINSNIFGI